MVRPPVAAVVTAAAAAFAAPALAEEPVRPINGSAQLARTLEAHGGVERWREAGTLRYTVVGFPLTPVVAAESRVTVDLPARRIRIDSAEWAIAHDGDRTFARPSADHLGLPPRFFAKGSTYFVMMPFVFADPGIAATDGQPIDFGGRRYDTVDLTYGEGVGDVNDVYTLLIDPDTDRLFAITHSVNEIDIEKVTWTFDAWQEAGGLLLPEAMTFRAGFNPQDPGEGSTASVSDVTLSEERPAAAVFAAREGEQPVP